MLFFERNTAVASRNRSGTAPIDETQRSTTLIRPVSWFCGLRRRISPSDLAGSGRAVLTAARRDARSVRIGERGGGTVRRRSGEAMSGAGRRAAPQRARRFIYRAYGCSERREIESRPSGAPPTRTTAKCIACFLAGWTETRLDLAWSW